MIDDEEAGSNFGESHAIYAEKMSKKLASTLLLAMLEKTGGDETKANSLAQTISTSAAIMVWRACMPGMGEEDFMQFVAEVWDCLSSLFDKSLEGLPAAENWSKGGNC